MGEEERKAKGGDMPGIQEKNLDLNEEGKES